MPAKSTDAEVQKAEYKTNLQESLRAQLLSARKNGDHIVSLYTKVGTWSASNEFVSTVTGLVNKHGADNLQFFQLDQSTQGGDVFHIAVLKFAPSVALTA